jgi:hypothetical protein
MRRAAACRDPRALSATMRAGTSAGAAD